jgi:hypothetical protein
MESGFAASARPFVPLCLCVRNPFFLPPPKEAR